MQPKKIPKEINTYQSITPYKSTIKGGYSPFLTSKNKQPSKSTTQLTTSSNQLENKIKNILKSESNFETKKYQMFSQLKSPSNTKLNQLKSSKLMGDQTTPLNKSSQIVEKKNPIKQNNIQPVQKVQQQQQQVINEKFALYGISDSRQQQLQKCQNLNLTTLQKKQMAIITNPDIELNSARYEREQINQKNKFTISTSPINQSNNSNILDHSDNSNINKFIQNSPNLGNSVQMANSISPMNTSRVRQLENNMQIKYQEITPKQQQQQQQQQFIFSKVKDNNGKQNNNILTDELQDDKYKIQELENLVAKKEQQISKKDMLIKGLIQDYDKQAVNILSLRQKLQQQKTIGSISDYLQVIKKQNQDLLNKIDMVEKEYQEAMRENVSLKKKCDQMQKYLEETRHRHTSSLSGFNGEQNTKIEALQEQLEEANKVKIEAVTQIEQLLRDIKSNQQGNTNMETNLIRRNEEYKRDIENYKKQIAILENHLEEAQKELQNSKSALSLSPQKKDFDFLADKELQESEITNNSTQLENKEHNEELHRLQKQNEQSSQQINVIQKQLQNKDLEIHLLKEQIEKYDKDIQNYLKSIQANQLKEHSLQQIIENYQLDNKSLQLSIEELRHQILEQNNQLEQVKDKGNQSMNIQKRLESEIHTQQNKHQTEEQNLIQLHLGEKEELSQQISNLSELISQLQQQITQQKGDLQNWEIKYTRESNDLQNNLDSEIKNKNNLQLVIDNIQKQNEELKIKLDKEVQIVNECNDLKQKLEENEKQILEKQEFINNQEVLISQMKELQQVQSNDKNDIQKQIEEYINQNQQMIQEKQQLQNKIDKSTQQNQQQIIEKEDQIQKLNKQIQFNDEFQKSQIQSHLNEKNEFQESLNQLQQKNKELQIETNNKLEKIQQLENQIQSMTGENAEKIKQDITNSNQKDEQIQQLQNELDELQKEIIVDQNNQQAEIQILIDQKEKLEKKISDYKINESNQQKIIEQMKQDIENNKTQHIDLSTIENEKLESQQEQEVQEKSKKARRKDKKNKKNQQSNSSISQSNTPCNKEDTQLDDSNDKQIINQEQINENKSQQSQDIQNEGLIQLQLKLEEIQEKLEQTQLIIKNQEDEIKNLKQEKQKESEQLEQQQKQSDSEIQQLQQQIQQIENQTVKSLREQIVEKEQEILQNVNQQKELEKDLLEKQDKLSNEKTELIQQNNQLTQTINTLQEEINQLKNNKIQSYEQQIKELQDQIQKIQIENKQKEQIQQELQQKYEKSTQKYEYQLEVTQNDVLNLSQTVQNKDLEISQISQELEEKVSLIKQNEQLISQKDEQKSKIQSHLEEAEQKIAQMTEQYKQIQEEKSSVQKELEQNFADNQKLTRYIEELRNQIQQQEENIKFLNEKQNEKTQFIEQIQQKHIQNVEEKDQNIEELQNFVLDQQQQIEQAGLKISDYQQQYKQLILHQRQKSTDFKNQESQIIELEMRKQALSHSLIQSENLNQEKQREMQQLQSQLKQTNLRNEQLEEKLQQSSQDQSMEHKQIYNIPSSETLQSVLEINASSVTDIMENPWILKSIFIEHLENISFKSYLVVLGESCIENQEKFLASFLGKKMSSNLIQRSEERRTSVFLRELGIQLKVFHDQEYNFGIFCIHSNSIKLNVEQQFIQNFFTHYCLSNSTAFIYLTTGDQKNDELIIENVGQYENLKFSFIVYNPNSNQKCGHKKLQFLESYDIFQETRNSKSHLKQFRLFLFQGNLNQKSFKFIRSQYGQQPNLPKDLQQQSTIIEQISISFGEYISHFNNSMKRKSQQNIDTLSSPQLRIAEKTSKEIKLTVDKQDFKKIDLRKNLHLIPFFDQFGFPLKINERCSKIEQIIKENLEYKSFNVILYNQSDSNFLCLVARNLMNTFKFIRIIFPQQVRITGMTEGFEGIDIDISDRPYINFIQKIDILDQSDSENTDDVQCKVSVYLE